MQKKYRSLKRTCIMFGMLMILLLSVSWNMAGVLLGILELCFFLYLMYWLDPGKRQKKHVKLIFFCLFLVCVGFGGSFNNILLRTAAMITKVLAAMLYLYSTKTPITFDGKFVKGFFFAIIYCPFAYVNTFWEIESLDKGEKIRRQKITNGIVFTFVIVLLMITPLYAVGDKLFGSWITIIIGWLWTNLLNFLTAAILGWIPAMLVYSYMRGLEEYNVLDVPGKGMVSKVDPYGMFFNLFSIRAILIGGIIVNGLFVISQLVYFFDTNKNYAEISANGNMIAIFGALILNGLFLAVLTLAIKEKRISGRSVSISSVNIYYALSITAVWVALCWRYVIVIFHYGIKGIWVLWGLAMLLFLACIAWNIMGILFDYQKFIKIICYGVMTLLLLFHLCIPEYWLGKINVAIFYYKYDNHLLVNVAKNEDVSQVVIDDQDLDIEYLKTLGEWSIPAFLAIKNIPNDYQGNGKKVSNIAEEEIFKLLEADLTVNELEDIRALGKNERHQKVITMLEEKIEYKLPGKKKIILAAVKNAFVNAAYVGVLR